MTEQEEKGKKIVVDESACIACGTCESIAPDYFKIEGGVSKVLKDYDEKDAALIDEAVESCAVQAITVE